MSPRRFTRRISWSERAASAALMIGVAGVFVYLETRLATVYSAFSVTQIKDVGDAVLITGEMVKARDCELISRAFYVAARDQSRHPRRMLSASYMINNTDSSPTHAPGAQVWGPWLLGKARVRPDDHVFMHVTHACNPFYETVSIHYLFPARLVRSLAER